MADERQQVSVGGRRLTLSNLDKVLYPDDGITKAEVIRYYLSVAPAMLRHVAGRALALVRYPDGITGESFFQKNRPKGAPRWLRSAVPPGEDIEYLILREEADLAWLGNMAALEIHQQHAREPHLDRPDYLMVDVDPPGDAGFEATRAIAIALREHLAGYGYHPHVKTTGGKGLHVVCPLRPDAEARPVLEAAREIVQAFRAKHPKRVTLALARAKRQGRVFLDVYRHNPAQTAVSPYSLRGRPGATVSLPISWDFLADLDDPRELNLRTVPGLLTEKGDQWAEFDEHRTPLHTAEVAETRTVRNGDGKPSDRLKPYAAKRSFTRTPEPSGAVRADKAAGRRFVVHRHHASHLHYDLRLEMNGVLRSWAVPKGLPPRPGITRLAIQTEDHPVEYLDFEGDIPKGEYGGGRMWIFDTGTFEPLEDSDGRLKVRLNGEGFRGDYRLVRKQKGEWLLQRIDEPSPDLLREPPEPMVPVLVEAIPDDRDLEYEVKWDGIRVLVVIDEGELRLITRRGIDVTDRFPELAAEHIRSRSAILDGEIVVLDAEGHPDFEAVLRRVQRRSRPTASIMGKHPVVCYLFDCLYLDGRQIHELPLWRRREWLEDGIRPEGPYRFSRSVPDGDELLAAVVEKGLEGIVGKDPHARYRPGDRHESWIKVKVRHEAVCAVVGYTPGKSRHAGSLGALHVAELVDDVLEYRGRAGSGLSDRQRDRLLQELDGLRVNSFPLEGPAPDDATGSVWVEPHLTVEVEYAEVTRGGRFRKPTIRRVRWDETVPSEAQ